MQNVLVTNITNIDQTVIIIPDNKATVLKPAESVIIDNYNEDHFYLYRSYQRKGLKVTYVDESAITSKTTKKEKKVVEATEEIPSQIEETVSDTAFEPLPEITEDNVNEIKESVPVVEEKPKKRSRKSKSDNSDKISATAESGE